MALQGRSTPTRHNESFAIREAHHEKSTWVVKERLEVALRRRFKVAEAEENEKECGMY
jgi:hypothetical protein